MPFMAATFLGTATTGQALATAAVISAAGTGVAMYGQQQQAKAQSAMAKYNAEAAAQEIKARTRSGQEEQQIRREQARKVLERQRVLYAKAGVQPILDVQLDTAEALASDIAISTYNNQLGIGRLRSEIGLQKYAASSYQQAGRMGMGATLFGGMSQLSQLGIQYSMAKQASS